MDWSDDDARAFIAEDGDSDGGVGMSFEALENIEAQRTLGLLQATEHRLYDATLTPTVKLEADENDFRHRYYNDGYEANYEGADNDEIIRWQRAFPHFRLIGTGQPIEPQQPDTCTAQVDSLSVHYVEAGAALSSGLSLEIVGTKITQAPSPQKQRPEAAGSEEEEDEEVFAQDGVLEEVIDVNVLKPEGSAATMDPAEQQREETIQGVIRHVWPSIVQHLIPLVQQVLQLADERSVPRDLEKLEALAQHSVMDVDDDAW